MNNLGISLIEVLIAISIISFISAAIAQAIIQQSQQQKRVFLKLEAADLKAAVQAMLASPASCTCQLQGQQFDSSTVDSSISSVAEIRSGCGPKYISLAKAGSAIFESLNGLKVESIEISKINSAGSPGEFIGFWNIKFKQHQGVTWIQDVNVPVRITADVTNPGSAKITNCGGAGPEVVQVVTGTNPVCPAPKETISRKWTTPTCVNYGNACALYQGWSGFPPSCESCANWEKCHMCSSTSWSATICL